MKHFKTHTASNNISRISKNLILGTTNGCIEIPNTTTFVSHTPSFDYLESTDISEKINCITQMDLGNSHTNILTSNEKQIKLFTVRNDTNAPLQILDMKETHQYSINDIAQLPSTHNFLSIDYLQLKMSNVELSSYTMIDIKPESIDNLRWLFTCLCVKDSNTFMYGTSNGNTFQCDIRQSPYSHTTNKMTEDVDEFYKFISNIEVEKNYFYVRNMKGVSVYDLRKNGLLKSYELLGERTKRLLYYRNECYERIQMSVDRGKILTGSYESKCYVIDGAVKEVEIDGCEMVKHCIWHENSVVVAKNNELYFYK